MGHWRFRNRIKLLPGVHLNIGKQGISSLSVGPRGAKVTIGKEKMSTTVGLPGTGLSYTESQKYSQPQAKPPPLPQEPVLTYAAEDLANLFPEEPEELAYYLWLADRQCGPYSAFQLIVMMANETVDDETLLWAEGISDWIPLSSLGLSDVVHSYRQVMDFS